ncbi:MAG: ribokinase [Actinomycetota bacterium]|nr:ribokinase [Actinomycetota bacterium]
MRSPNRSGRVCVVGSVNTDYVLRVARRPDPGETVADATLEVHPGGKGANQAIAAARSGAAVDIVACVGADAPGAARIVDLRAESTGTEHVVVTSRAPTGVAMITVTPDGENAIVVAPGANSLLSPADLEPAREALARTDALVVQLEVPVATVVRAAELLAPGALLVVNCAPFRPLPSSLLARADVLVANVGEAAALTGRDARAGAAALAASARRLGPRSVVVTAGRDGAYVSASRGSSRHPAPRVTALDTTGAGDAFVGALAADLSRGSSLDDAVARAVLVGASTVQSPGALARVPPGLFAG